MKRNGSHARQHYILATWQARARCELNINERVLMAWYIQVAFRIPHAVPNAIAKVKSLDALSATVHHTFLIARLQSALQYEAENPESDAGSFAFQLFCFRMMHFRHDSKVDLGEASSPTSSACFVAVEVEITVAFKQYRISIVLHHRQNLRFKFTRSSIRYVHEWTHQ